MAPSFGRSISFPLSPARVSRARAAAYHVRSVSLPCHSHPLLSHLATHISAVRAWIAAPSAPSTGLARLDALHAALAELLLLPEARAALESGSNTADCLLDSFLNLADAHGAFQELLLELRAHSAEAQAALRRRDDNRLASAVRSLRRAEKDLARLAASVRVAAKFPTPSASTSAAEVEVSVVLAEAVATAACASAAVFSPSRPCPRPPPPRRPPRRPRSGPSSCGPRPPPTRTRRWPPWSGWRRSRRAPPRSRAAATRCSAASCTPGSPSSTSRPRPAA
ncbi:hypothetical protein CFC21_111840, partial [Triticum aestivum]